VVCLNKPGRMAIDMPCISGHSAAVLDFEFNPFNDQILSTGSEDTTVKVWGIPEGGLTEHITTPLVDLHGHSRKVTLLRSHPTADNVLASVGGENCVKLWDIEKGCEMNSLATAHEQLIQDIVWDHCGKEYATSCKDKNIRFIDPRSATVTGTIEQAHEGAKSMKLTYAGHLDRLISVGFTRQSQRQFKIWDPRNTSQEIEKVDIDQAAGVIMPFFDADTNLLYLAGKGDGNIRFYEISNETTPGVYPLSDFRSSVSAKGMAWVPKRGLDVMSCETARLMKLTTNSVEPLSFFVPRKSDSFQDDLYPDTASYTAAHTADEWMAGSDLPPVLMSLNPAVRGSAAAAPVEKKVFAAVKSPAVLQAELDKANARIAELEGLLAAAGLATK
jgi:coronin-1B/1C/6